MTNEELTPEEMACYEALIADKGPITVEQNALAVNLAKKQARAEGLLNKPVIFSELDMQDQVYYLMAARGLAVRNQKKFIKKHNSPKSLTREFLESVGFIINTHKAMTKNAIDFINELEGLQALVNLYLLLGDENND